MNLNHSKSTLFTGVAGVALALALGAVVVLTGPAPYGAAGAVTSVYGQPVPALDGETLAGYLAAHESNRLGPVLP